MFYYWLGPFGNGGDSPLGVVTGECRVSSTEQQVDPERRRNVRSFVLRTGRITAAQASAIDSWWPKYGLDQSDGLLDLSAAFGRDKPVSLEIGFGMGDSLLTMAEQKPEQDFIGIEVHTPGVGSLLAGAAEKDLQNIRVYRQDAVQVLANCFAEQSLDTVQIFFPDPWHKKRHHKRRLIQQPFLDLLLPRLKSGGILHIATDWQHYADHCLQLLTAESRLQNTAEDSGFVPRPASRPVTKFERRGERLGHGVWDLIFERVHD